MKVSRGKWHSELIYLPRFYWWRRKWAARSPGWRRSGRLGSSRLSCHQPQGTPVHSLLKLVVPLMTLARLWRRELYSWGHPSQRIKNVSFEFQFSFHLKITEGWQAHPSALDEHYHIHPPTISWAGSLKKFLKHAMMGHNCVIGCQKSESTKAWQHSRKTEWSLMCRSLFFWSRKNREKI